VRHPDAKLLGPTGQCPPTLVAHLNDAEAKAETSPRVPLLMAIRDTLALGLREEL
jgi:hypothetical protein